MVKEVVEAMLESLPLFVEERYLRCIRMSLVPLWSAKAEANGPLVLVAGPVVAATRQVVAVHSQREDEQRVRRRSGLLHGLLAVLAARLNVALVVDSIIAKENEECRESEKFNVEKRATEIPIISYVDEDLSSSRYFDYLFWVGILPNIVEPVYYS